MDHALEPRVEGRQAWGRELCHPLPLAAVLLLVLNDHLLKGADLLPGWLTGKLSDVAGLFFFPALLTAAVRGAASLLGRPLPRAGGGLGLGAVLLTGAIFAATKLWPALNLALARSWGLIAMDPTDLLALPVLGLAWLWLRARDARAA